MYRYVVFLQIVVFLSAISCDLIKPSEPAEEDDNISPVAKFTVYPLSGSTWTEFYFNASTSLDNEDLVEDLVVRWDWENDGTWDTNYDSSKVITHQYTTEGLRTVVLEVKDTGGLTDTTTHQITVTDGGVGETSTMNGNDGKVYQTVKIGDQWWMAENLRETQYRNGEPIPEVTGADSWDALLTGARCAYNNDENNESDSYGYLYNWHAIGDSNNIAPSGWHVPTEEEWKTLEIFLGMSETEAEETGFRGTDEGGKLKERGTDHWMSPNIGATNYSGFTALPGGYRQEAGVFYGMGYYASFWSSSEDSTSINPAHSPNAWRACSRYLNTHSSGINKHNSWKKFGCSVRLIQD